jgi:hypothetical protein
MKNRKSIGKKNKGKNISLFLSLKFRIISYFLMKMVFLQNREEMFLQVSIPLLNYFGFII